MTQAETLAAMQEHIKHIDENTACLPGLCESVVRHDEQIKGLRAWNTRLWPAAATVIGALLGHLIRWH